MFLSVVILGRFTTETHAMALYVNIDTPPLLTPHPGTQPETLAQSRSHFLYQLVSQLVILFAFCAQALAIQRDRSGRLHRARVEPPAIGGYQPRPSEHVAAAQSLNRQAAVTRSNDFERDFSVADEIEDIGFSAFLKDELTGVEADVRRTSDYQLMTTRVHPAKERMLSQNAFKRLHCVFLFPGMQLQVGHGPCVS